jgi:peptidoglycan/LPS O-acetylase OafA/YrhL
MSFVVLGHLGGKFGPYTDLDSPSIRLARTLLEGSFGSTIFLLISGFAVYSRCRDEANFGWRKYLKARAVRILPVYWAALAAFVLLDRLTAFRGRLPLDGWEAAGAVLQNALLLAPVLGHPSLLTASWTLTYIAIGYVAIPLIAQGFLALRLGYRGRLLLISGFALLWMGAPLLWHGLGSCGVALAIGMAVCEASRRWNLHRLPAWLIDASAAGAFVASLLLLETLNRPSNLVRVAVAVVPGVLLLLGRLGSGGLLNPILTGRSAQWIGKVSYSAYFAHGASQVVALQAVLAVQPRLAGIVPGELLLCGGFVFGYFLALGAAALLHYGLEHPLTRMFRPAKPAVPAEMAPVRVPARSAVA